MSAARYPNGSSNRYLTTFSNIHFTVSNSSEAIGDSDGADAQRQGGTSLSGNSSRSTHLVREEADEQLDAARQQLKEAVDGLQRLQHLDNARVAGRDTAELYHFFNQPAPTPQPTQPVICVASQPDCRLLSNLHFHTMVQLLLPLPVAFPAVIRWSVAVNCMQLFK